MSGEKQHRLSAPLRQVIRANAVERFVEAWRQAFRDEALMDFLTWVERHRLLPPDCAMQGRFSWDEVPYLREIAERIFDGMPSARIIALGKGSQLGFTDLVINCLLYILSGSGTNRQPAIFLSSTAEISKTMVKNRLRPELERPPFRGMFGRVGTKSAKNTLGEIISPGGSVINGGGQSVNAFSSRNAGKIFADEFARMPLEVGAEGDVVSLLRKRIDTYGDAGRVVALSTPVGATAETGSFQALLEAGDKREYHVPCPHCSHKQTLQLKNFGIDRDEDGMAIDGFFKCVECGERMEERHRRAMVQAGEWIASKKPKYKDVTSYVACSQFYSLLGVTLGKIAVEWDAVLNGDASKVSFYNTVLGLGMDMEIESVGTQEARLHVYPNPDKVVPHNCDMLTAGIDVQRRFAVVSVYAWEKSSKRGWLIDHYEVPGEWMKPETREAVKASLREGYEVEGGDEGERMLCTAAAVDSGDGSVTDAVYRFCEEFAQPEVESGRKWRIRASAGMIVVPFKGSNAVEQKSIIHLVGNIPKSVKRRTRTSIRVWHGGGTILKAMLYRALSVAPETEMDGGVKFRKETPEAFFAEITAERPEEKRLTSGHKRLTFTLPRGANNEALDCFQMARLAAEVIWASVGGGVRGLKRNRPAAQNSEPAPVENDTPKTDDNGEKSPTRKAPKRRRGLMSRAGGRMTGAEILRRLRGEE